ncbi:MAG TPA: pyridoxal 5'-phosphate synthase glutaminase subunit PdxT [Acidobacteriota bacterium]
MLSFQGDFEAHTRAVQQAGAEPLQVRNRDQLGQCEALIIPGGESTTFLKFLELENFTQPLIDFGRERPIFGTCAGAILLASQVENPPQFSLGLMDMTVRRNAYGRQADSHSEICRSEMLQPDSFEAIFIRAPAITRVGDQVQVLASRDSNPIWVRQGLHWAATFHPELSRDRRIHELFLEETRKRANR